MLLELDMKTKSLTIGLLSIVSAIIFALIGPKLIPQCLLIGIFLYTITGDRPTLIYAICRKLPRDLIAGFRFAKVNILINKWERDKMTVAKVFAQVAKQHPNKIAFMMDDTKITFQEVDSISNQIASYFKSKNYKRGDTVALFMEPHPFYPCVWLGLSKIGVTTALINSNLRNETLIHSIKISNSKGLILGSELASALQEIRHENGVSELPLYQNQYRNQRDVPKFAFLPDAFDLASELKSTPSIGIEDEILEGKSSDKLVYIYTSGTTGLPKAAVITNIRYMFIAIASAKAFNIDSKDTMYTALPLYHTAGGIVGVGNVLLFGVTLAIRAKFSASNFWTDCIRYECTIAQYIGELCRYLLSTPEKPTDTQHKLRLMIGNGLRPQIWPDFVKRFKIKHIGELYGSTEGNSNLVNFDNQVGAVGFVPRFAHFFYPVTLIKCDEGTGEPVRGANGRCIRCKPGEPGLFVGKINPKVAINSFSGYVDKQASKKKVLHNVFTEGDAYFDSGDVLTMDILGYFYFKDRLGDTFRWKGENVATSEVEAVISNIIKLQDSVVYGVKIPHSEGSAGMAAIVDLKREVNIEALSVGIQKSLPPYARPVFLRIVENLPMTGTFKLKKRDLQIEGFDINKIKEPIYMLRSDGTYKIFSQKDYDDVVNGNARM